MSLFGLTFWILLLFQVKHFVCDYPLQTTYMLGKFKEHGWGGPLLAHAAVNGVGTFIVVLVALVEARVPDVAFAVILGVTDAGSHFVVDRIKASPKLLGRWKSDSPYFWWTIGLDQAVHHIIGIVLAFLTISTIVAAYAAVELR